MGEERGILNTGYCECSRMPADIMTKALDAPRSEELKVLSANTKISETCHYAMCLENIRAEETHDGGVLKIRWR